MTSDKKIRGFWFFLTLSVGLFVTAGIAWFYTLFWEGIVTFLVNPSVSLSEKLSFIEGVLPGTASLVILFTFLLWGLYSLNPDRFPVRDILDGLLGLSKDHYKEPAAKAKTETASDIPKFDKETELLKITLVSEEIRSAYWNFNAIYFSFMIPVAIVELGFGSQIGIAVYVGLLSVLLVLAGLAIVSTRRYLRRFSRLQPLIHNVENGKANGDLNEILKGLGK
jgi:hypothetical protein